MLKSLQQQMASSSSAPSPMTEKVKNRGFRFLRLFHFKLFQSTEIATLPASYICVRKGVLKTHIYSNSGNWLLWFALLLSFVNDKPLQKWEVSLAKSLFGCCSPKGPLHHIVTYFGNKLYWHIFLYLCIPLQLVNADIFSAQCSVPHIQKQLHYQEAKLKSCSFSSLPPCPKPLRNSDTGSP